MRRYEVPALEIIYVDSDIVRCSNGEINNDRWIELGPENMWSED